ncbi:MAG: glycosyltransferase family 9 protein [Ferruginibacter sp.]|nr:glycosyltransferase family 9 protein [Cytophagales bacterium]
MKPSSPATGHPRRSPDGARSGFPRGGPPPPDNAPRFLLIQTAFLGDVVLATALIEKLRAFYPQARIDFLLRKGNEGLLAAHPHLGEVLVWDKQRGKYRDLGRLVGDLRRRRYSHVINLQRFASTGWLTAFSGAREKIGFSKNPFSFLFTRRVPHRIAEGVHEVRRNLDLIDFLTDDAFVGPKLYPSPADFERVRPYQTRPYVCIAPTSVWFTKQFPRSQWVGLINQIPLEYQIYLLGSPPDAGAGEEIGRDAGLKNTERVHNLAGALSLLASAALMRGAVLNYVNDSAPLHLASAVDAPTCAVYCSTVPAFGFGPLAAFSRIVEIQSPLACRPCGLHGRAACPLGHFKCAHEIATGQLTRVLAEAIRAKPDGATN